MWPLLFLDIYSEESIMKRLFTIIWLASSIIALTCMVAFGQLPYSWYPTNPSWTSSNSTDSTLDFQSAYGLTSTSDSNTVLGGWYSYKNGQITSYTSPTYNFSCTSNVRIDIRLTVNLENKYDWMYFQYSINGGTTWVNPVVNGPNNLSGINLSAYPPLINWANNNSNKKGWSGQIGAVVVSYTVLASATFKMRFIFESDASLILWYRNDGAVDTYQHGAYVYPVDVSNSYVIGTNPIATGIYFCDITSLSVVCIASLPIELLNTPTILCNGNNRVISWTTASEHNSNVFVVQSSEDGMFWNNVDTVQAAHNSNTPISYSVVDYNLYYPSTVYYQLYQIDNDGQPHIYGYYISNCTTTGIIELYPNPSTEGEPIHFNGKNDVLTVNVYDLLGREIISIYSNGTLTGLSSGAYIVNINGTRVIKVIVK